MCFPSSVESDGTFDNLGELNNYCVVESEPEQVTDSLMTQVQPVSYVPPWQDTLFDNDTLFD